MVRIEAMWETTSVSFTRICIVVVRFHPLLTLAKLWESSLSEILTWVGVLMSNGIQLHGRIIQNNFVKCLF